MQMLQEPVYRRTTATEIARIDYAAFAQGMGLAFNQITDNADALTGVQRALATPGPVLTRVVVSYEGRELRWLNALRSRYVRKLPNARRPDWPPESACDASTRSRTAIDVQEMWRILED